MSDAQVIAVYRCLYGPGPDVVESFAMTALECATALLLRYPLAVNIEDIFTRGDLTVEWRAEAYALFRVAP